MEDTTQTQEQSDAELVKEFSPCYCSHCGLDLDIHDGSGLCPGGTEEFGGRR